MTLRTRELDRDADAEIELVATRMRATLEEVLGREEGAALYTMDWLRDRVRFHLDPSRSTAAVFLAEHPSGGGGGAVVGHTIVRIERDDDDDDRPFGLFSTTYVEPGSRRAGVAHHLLRRGEAWMRERGLRRAVTDTSATNTKLIRLYEAHGYTIVVRAGSMVRLAKPLDPETT